MTRKPLRNQLEDEPFVPTEHGGDYLVSILGTIALIALILHLTGIL